MPGVGYNFSRGVATASSQNPGRLHQATDMSIDGANQNYGASGGSDEGPAA